MTVVSWLMVVAVVLGAVLAFVLWLAWREAPAQPTTIAEPEPPEMASACISPEMESFLARERALRKDGWVVISRPNGQFFARHFNRNEAFGLKSQTYARALDEALGMVADPVTFLFAPVFDEGRRCSDCGYARPSWNKEGHHCTHSSRANIPGLVAPDTARSCLVFIPRR